MQIDFHKNFNKSYAKLSTKQKQHVKKIIELFKQNPHDTILKNHALHGKLQGHRAISAGGDLRLVFEEEGNYERIEFSLVGTHAQVY